MPFLVSRDVSQPSAHARGHQGARLQRGSAAPATAGDV
jgi:hypothetical protein